MACVYLAVKRVRLGCVVGAFLVISERSVVGRGMQITEIVLGFMYAVEGLLKVCSPLGCGFRGVRCKCVPLVATAAASVHVGV